MASVYGSLENKYDEDGLMEPANLNKKINVVSVNFVIKALTLSNKLPKKA